MAKFNFLRMLFFLGKLRKIPYQFYNFMNREVSIQKVPLMYNGAILEIWFIQKNNQYIIFFKMSPRSRFSDKMYIFKYIGKRVNIS